MQYIFRIAVAQKYLDHAKPYEQWEFGGASPITYVRIDLRSDGMDAVCDTPPTFSGDDAIVMWIREWLQDNCRVPAPGTFDLNFCTPRQVYWGLASPAGRAQWAWEVDTDDPADFEVDEDGKAPTEQTMWRVY